MLQQIFIDFEDVKNEALKDAECAYYPASRKLVVINNSDQALTTTVRTGNGTKEFFLQPFEMKIVEE